MSQVRINFLHWQPDQEDTGNEGLITAQNVLHSHEGYKQVAASTTTSLYGASGYTAHGMNCRSIGTSGQQLAAYITLNHGAGPPYTGSLKISLAEVQPPLDTSSITSTLSAINSSVLTAFQVAELEDKVFAVAKSQHSVTGGAIEERALAGFFTFTAVGTEAVYSSATWIDESANITGETCATVGQFIMVGSDYSVQWCAISDPDDWPTPGTADARSKQAGIENLETAYGVVTGIAGGDFFGYIFQERAVTKVTYVGGDIVFSFDVFERSRGCFEYNRYAQVGERVFYQSKFGYHMLVNDTVTDIGFGKVDKSHTPTNSATLTGEYYNWGAVPSVGVHVGQKNVCANEAISTVFFEDAKIAYNYKTDQWSEVPALNSGSMFSINSSDGIIGQSVYIGSDQHQLETSDSGSPATATMVTGEYSLGDGRAIIDSVEPLHDGASLASVRIGVRDLQSDSVTWSTGTALNSRTGASNFRAADNTAEGRFHRAELVATGGFTTISGADFAFIPAGKT